jgi:putative NIF3 family GTP cyclohydrolase 1 type 2
MLSLTSIALFLDEYFRKELYTKEQNGIIVPADKDITRLGLALEPWEGITAWIEAQQLDALFIHRYWHLNRQELPSGTGILAYHLPFDEKLTLGYNPLLAKQLHVTDIAVFGCKEGRPLGMTGYISPVPALLLQQKIAEIFGGTEAVIHGKSTEITKVAVVGAMTVQLVREAAANGVQLYITGQLRKPAAQAVQETGMHVVAVGHRRSEQWGLHLLATVLGNQWQFLEVVVADI